MSTGKRGFNAEYLSLMKHLGMEPRTIELGKKEQDGDVEALNGALKRRLLQHLLMRGSRDFESATAYESWVQGVLEKANRLRAAKVEEESASTLEAQVEQVLALVAPARPEVPELALAPPTKGHQQECSHLHQQACASTGPGGREEWRKSPFMGQLNTL